MTILMLGAGVINPAVIEGASVKLNAKLQNDQIYINSKDLIKALGGTGQYDTKTGTFIYTAKDDIPEVVEAVSPSVVGIIGRPDAGEEGASSDRYNLTHGTGVIIKSNGWIVTNAHVIEGLSNAVVVTSDGKSYKITDSYSDRASDLALIKINAKSLKPAKLASSSSNMRVGETVIAIGTPVSFSLRNSATVGVVSGLNRGVNASYRLIQSDTAINPGNSGGPLVNLKGEVIGINTMKYAAVGVENTGFSIPAETMHYVINHYFKYGEVKRASLGLTLEESWSAIVGLPTDDPLTVTSVDTNEADKAKIQEGDVLYSIDGVRVTSVVDINELLKKYLPGQRVKLLMQSDGDIVTRYLVLTQGENTVFSVEDEAWDEVEQ
ncbi:trypsin-like peptidase domain-containing protein [Paenibacillus urinalis]|uniref:Trypsin-like peptidase domain-containing protein n=2 Tax=Paenibacillus urinalis TaxID=521520 RepID=A0AAX3MX71_9BACL|nr:trypsin-like peptidase domain-containing protein [Paenibacillus urinalis]WDH82205.1 trypsin-like peptidase domain-containing protein [Paenibacillus urinalis]WDH98254.1 trypsin-like peptidase domain-containing protein [Paenibacillus urinalis]